MKLREVIFDNKDALPAKCILHVATSSIADVMRLYGGYYGGDRYVVTVDGEPVPITSNGDLVGDLP